MKKRKHRLVVELTVQEPITTKNLGWALYFTLENFGAIGGSIVNKVKVKSLDKILTAEKQKLKSQP